MLATPPCPWDQFRPAAVHFCERELCAWIEQPANTWSNLAYVIVGLVIIRLARREGHPQLAAIGLIEILLGFGSAYFHASSTHWGEVVDIGCMFLFSSYVLVINFNRWLCTRGPGLSRRVQVAIFLLISSVSILAVSLFQGWVGIVLFAAQAVGAGRLERLLYRQRAPGVSYRPLFALLGTFALAWGIWWLDILKIVCDPDNHFLQGHAAWHLLNSLCFLFLYRFYRQLRPAGSEG